MPRKLSLAALALAVLLAGCGGGARPSATPSAERALGPSTRLADLEHPGRKPALFSLFNAGQGVPRLVLLVSPT